MDCQLVTIPLPSGINIEANYWLPPETHYAGSKLAVCLHPWSWLGGRKDDPVLRTVARPLLSRHYHVLQYNSRGVGNSSGWPSFTGSSEVEDLQGVLTWAMQRVSNVVSVVIIGYSHGALIASMCPVQQGVETLHLLISYPLGPRSWLTLFNSSKYATALESLVKSPNSNVAIFYGDRDEFTSASSYREWATGLREHAHVVEVEGATHFWQGHGRELIATVEDWLGRNTTI